MDQQNQNNGKSNNISADDLLKKLKENIDLAGESEDEDIDLGASGADEAINPPKIGEQIRLPIDGPADSQSGADNADVGERADEAPVSADADDADGALSGGEQSENADAAVKKNKPLQIQHRYKFRRSSRPKASETTAQPIINESESFAPLNEAKAPVDAADTAEAPALNAAAESAAERISENAQNKANEESSEMLERLMKKYMSSDELEKYHPTEEDALGDEDDEDGGYLTSGEDGDGVAADAADEGESGENASPEAAKVSPEDETESAACF